MLAVFLKLFALFYISGPIWPHFLLILHGWLAISVFPCHILFVPKIGMQ